MAERDSDKENGETDINPVQLNYSVPLSIIRPIKYNKAELSGLPEKNSKQ